MPPNLMFPSYNRNFLIWKICNSHLAGIIEICQETYFKTFPPNFLNKTDLFESDYVAPNYINLIRPSGTPCWIANAATV